MASDMPSDCSDLHSTMEGIDELTATDDPERPNQMEEIGYKVKCLLCGNDAPQTNWTSVELDIASPILSFYVAAGFITPAMKEERLSAKEFWLCKPAGSENENMEAYWKILEDIFCKGQCSKSEPLNTNPPPSLMADLNSPIIGPIAHNPYNVLSYSFIPTAPMNIPTVQESNYPASLNAGSVNGSFSVWGSVHPVDEMLTGTQDPCHGLMQPSQMPLESPQVTQNPCSSNSSMISPLWNATIPACVPEGPSQMEEIGNHVKCVLCGNDAQRTVCLSVKSDRAHSILEMYVFLGVITSATKNKRLSAKEFWLCESAGLEYGDAMCYDNKEDILKRLEDVIREAQRSESQQKDPTSSTSSEPLNTNPPPSLTADLNSPIGLIVHNLHNLLSSVFEPMTAQTPCSPNSSMRSPLLDLFARHEYDSQGKPTPMNMFPSSSGTFFLTTVIQALLQRQAQQPLCHLDQTVNEKPGEKTSENRKKKNALPKVDRQPKMKPEKKPRERKPRGKKSDQVAKGLPSSQQAGIEEEGAEREVLEALEECYVELRMDPDLSDIYDLTKNEVSVFSERFFAQLHDSLAETGFEFLSL